MGISYFKASSVFTDVSEALGSKNVPFLFGGDLGDGTRDGSSEANRPVKLYGTHSPYLFGGIRAEDYDLMRK